MKTFAYFNSITGWELILKDGDTIQEYKYKTVDQLHIHIKKVEETGYTLDVMLFYKRIQAKRKE